MQKRKHVELKREDGFRETLLTLANVYHIIS